MRSVRRNAVSSGTLHGMLRSDRHAQLSRPLLRDQTGRLCVRKNNGNNETGGIYVVEQVYWR